MEIETRVKTAISTLEDAGYLKRGQNSPRVFATSIISRNAHEAIDKITAYRLSKDTEIPQTRISQIIKGKRRVTADTALRFSSYFGNSAKFWLGLQDDYDIEEEKGEKEAILFKIFCVK